MQTKELKELHSFMLRQRDLLREQRWHDFIHSMRAFLEKFPKAGDLLRRVDAVERQYFFMLRLLVESENFGSTAQVASEFGQSLGALLREVELEFHAAYDPAYFYGRLRYIRMRPEETLQTIFADYIQEYNDLAMDPAAFTDTRRRSRLEVMASDIFDRIWTAGALEGEQAEFVKTMVGDGTLPVYDREMWVHAIGFGDLYSGACDQLLEDIAGMAESRVAVAARVWTVLRGLYRFSNPKGMMPEEPSAALQEYAAENPAELADIILFYIQSALKTERGGNIMADLMNLGRQGGLNIFSADAAASPEKIMDNLPPEYSAKMRDMTEAQLRGDDVFVESLGRMRHFPFFSKVANWFLPFHMEHSDLAPLVDADGAGVASLMEKIPGLCDSDKYALMLSMASTPPQVRGAALTNMYSSYTRLADSPEGESMLAGIEGAKPRKVHVSNVAKNIGRVMRFCQDASGVFPSNPLELSLFLASLPGGDKADMRERLADSFMRLGYYTVAADLYWSCARTCDGPDNAPDRARTSRKCAEAYEALGKWSHALNYRLRAAESGDDSYENALALVKDARKVPDANAGELSDYLAPFRDDRSGDPEYLRLLAEAYFDEENWSGALDVLYNLEYVLPEDDSSIKWLMMRALLYNDCFDDARGIMARLRTQDPEGHLKESVEFGAVLWYKGHRKEALELLTALVGADRAKFGRVSAMLFRMRDSELERIYGGDGDAPTSLLRDALNYRFLGSRFGSI